MHSFYSNADYAIQNAMDQSSFADVVEGTLDEISDAVEQQRAIVRHAKAYDMGHDRGCQALSSEIHQLVNGINALLKNLRVEHSARHFAHAV